MRQLIALGLLALGAGPPGTWAAPSATRAATVRVRLVEFEVVLSRAAVPAGRVTFVVRNAGKIAHNFVVLRTNLPPSKLPTVGAVASEAGRQGKTPVFGPGATRRLTLTLRPGRYVLICNVAGHYSAGMFVGFRVR